MIAAGEDVARRRARVMMVVGLAVTVVAAAGAVRAARSPFPSFFVDPYGFFSTANLPRWQTSDLRHTDRVIAVDGVPIGDRLAWRDTPASRLRERIALHHAGDRVSIRFQRAATQFTRDVEVQLLPVGDVGFFFGVYALVGWFVLWSAIVVLHVAERAQGASAYAGWALGTFLFLLSFFDYHAQNYLGPLFPLSTILVTFGFFWLAHSFPDPPAGPGNRLRWLVGGGRAVALTAVLFLILAWPLGWDARWLLQAIVAAAVVAIATLVVSVVARARSSRGRRRAELAAAALGLAITPVPVALILVLARLRSDTWFHLALPFVVAVVPSSIGYALIRTNILATRQILRPGLLVVPLAVFGIAIAWTAAVAIDRVAHLWGMEYAVPLAVAVVVLIGAWILGERLLRRVVFRAAAQFRPAIEQLGEQLASLSDAGEIRSTIQTVIAGWLPGVGIAVLEPGAVASIAALPPSHHTDLATGRDVWTTADPWERNLLVPMRSLGELRGVLRLSPKHHAALYTSEDLELLHTIAGIGAVALHTAAVMSQLDELRRLEVGATRDEKLLSLGLLGAEVSHELAVPLNYFRYLLRRGAGGKALDAEEIEIGTEEVERLERMLGALRRLEPPSTDSGPVDVRVPLRRALDLLRGLLEERRVETRIDLPPSLVLMASADPLLQVFANLLRNAAQAAPPGGHVGVRSSFEGGELCLEVWDDGPGIPPSLAQSLFRPWVTNKEGGSGLGLAVTRRLVQTWGWRITLEREGGRTCLRIHVPRSSWRIGAPDAASPPSPSEPTGVDP